MKVSSPVLFVSFLIGAAIAENVAQNGDMAHAKNYKRGPTDQEKADRQAQKEAEAAQKEAEKAQRDAEKEAARIERQASKDAEAAQEVTVSTVIYL